MAIGGIVAVSALILGLVGLGAGSAQAAAPAWRVLAATAPTNLPPVTKEVQRFAVDASGGTFTLAFEGDSTEAFPYDAQPSAIQAAVDALPSVGGVGGAVTITGGPGNPGAQLAYIVSFGGDLAGRDVPELTADASGLLGGASTVSVNTSVTGQQFSEAGNLVVAVTNVGGAESAAAPLLTASIGPLPVGIESRALSEFGWICPAAEEGTVLVCTYSLNVAAERSPTTFKVPLNVQGALAPKASNVEVSVSGGDAAPDRYETPLVVSSAPSAPGLAAFWAGAFDADGHAELQAGAHPYSASTAFWLTTNLAPDGVTVVPAGALRTADVGLPPGFIGNPLATQKRCPQEALDRSHDEGVASPLCTADGSLVGSLAPAKGGLVEATFGGALASEPAFLYNDLPAFGSAAQFTANVDQFAHTSLFGSVRSDADFGVDVGGFNLPPILSVFGNLAILEGFPTSALGKAFLRNPTDCSLQREEAVAGREPLATLQTNSWTNPDPNAIEDETSAVQPVVTGCGALTEAWLGHGPEPLNEEPSFSFQPSTTAGSSPTGASADLRVPQAGLTDPNKLAASDLKKTVVTLPQGLSLNPSAANGLQSCSEAQVGYVGPGAMPNPTRFNEAPVSCPEASRIGTVKIKSPLLEEELGGTIYLAAQEENPFNSLLALYLVVESERFGLTLKLPGEVKPDPNTGQLTATFDNNPQLPFEDLSLQFRGGGPRSTLATPETCGHFETTGSLEPWSAENGEALQIRESGFSVGDGCSSSDATRPFSPSFEAGTTSTQAGAYAPLVVKVGRRDGEQELTRLDFTLPLGLTAKLAGVGYCPASAIAEAEGKTGKAEQASPSCPASSLIGTVDTAAGVGTEPVHVGGHVYLAGPYGGAQLSSVVITPAVAGPFDLGNVVVRAPLFVNSETTQITAKSDEIPHILKGIPLKLRSVEVKVDRQNFSLNPTNCDPMAAGAKMTGLNGATASPSNRFQVGGCQTLPFKPNLKLQVIGKTNRNSKPRLKAVLTTKPGEANIRRAQVNLPHSEFLEQNHIKTVCTRVQYAEGNGNGSACPRGSIYGKAKAWTPLLDHPLEGYVYLRSNGGERKLPDLVAGLNGQINVALQGKTDSGPNHGLRNTFEVVPDAPVSRFVLELNGKKKGLLVNSENLCKTPKAKRQAIVRLTGQNGKVHAFKPLVQNQCKKKKGGGKKAKGGGKKGR